MEAEARLRRLFRRHPRDVEALLLLATLKRRRGRLDEARQLLQQLARRDAAAQWHVEIRRERELLRRKLEEQRLEAIQQVADQDIGADSGIDSDGVTYHEVEQLNADCESHQATLNEEYYLRDDETTGDTDYRRAA